MAGASLTPSRCGRGGQVLASHRAIETTVSTELQSLEDRMRSEVQSKVGPLARSQEKRDERTKET